MISANGNDSVFSSLFLMIHILVFMLSKILVFLLAEVIDVMLVLKRHIPVFLEGLLMKVLQQAFVEAN